MVELKISTEIQNKLVHLEQYDTLLTFVVFYQTNKIIHTPRLKRFFLLKKLEFFQITLFVNKFGPKFDISKVFRKSYFPND
jgi:hypothetical protein